jgi:hypothetical protein
VEEGAIGGKAVVLSAIAVVGVLLGGYRDVVEQDWARQEARFEREAGSVEAVQGAVKRAGLLLADLASALDVSAEQARLAQLSARAEGAESLSGPQRLALYNEVRWLCRDAAFRNPLVGDGPLLFMQRRRFICQMLHEYLGYYYDYGDVEGGGIYMLANPGESFETRELIAGRLPRGNYTTLAFSYDGKTVYFAFSARSEGKPDFYSPERSCFHLYAMDAGGENLRQLTDGPNDDFDPCPLPDGGLAFMSSRRGGFTRCNNPWEPLPAHTLHRLDPDGTIRALSVHETSEWHPHVLNDGRIAYTRWDYVDRSAAHFHGIWAINPDGTGSRQIFGNYTQRINACYQPHSIPGSERVAFLAGAHHANVGGSLVLFDPARAALVADDGGDSFAAIEALTPEVCYPETPDVWPKTYYHSPWPLSEDYFLISFSFDPLPGMSSLTKKDTETGIYLFDRFGNLELLYREPGISSMYPIPARPRPAPPAIPSMRDPSLGDDGVFLLSNVYESHLPFPSDRPIRELRVFQILPKSETHVANRPRLGYANAESARMLLGTAPVEADGSAYFRAPTLKPLAFQAVDAEGKAVQGMRSVIYLQPGERRSCVGCHESTGRPPGKVPGRPLAAVREPSRLTSGPDGSMPWSYTRLVQPVLDRNCVACHDGEAKTRLTGRWSEPFSESYEALRPFVRWYEWGGASISQITTRPGEMPADVSLLGAVLEDENHAGIEMAEADWRVLYLWLDGNASFYGAYSAPERFAQRKGDAIHPPDLQ